MNLDRFCSEDSSRPMIYRPWVHLLPDGRSITVATNGHIGVSIPGAAHGALPWTGSSRMTPGLFETFKPTHTLDLASCKEFAGDPVWPIDTAYCRRCGGAARVVCRGCFGSGSRSCECECGHQHESACWDCCGKGSTACPVCCEDDIEINPVSFGGTDLSQIYLARVLSPFAGETVQARIGPTCEAPVHFTDGTVVAVIMPLRPDDQDHQSLPESAVVESHCDRAWPA
jgi:hypothetical protein